MKAFLAALAFLLAAGAARAGAPSWPQNSYNPDPATGDLTLPMPCGGAMVFRPVPVPATGSPIDDLAVLLGNFHGPVDDYNDGAHGAFIAAPFPASSGPPVFWLGKYTVTQAQYAAMSGHCPATISNLPQTSISWFDAVGFTQQYSSWLLGNSPGALPVRGSSIGFIRLPTETEWEFAARGGESVPPSTYLASAWVPPEQLGDYAVAGQGPGAGPSPIGSKEANPLGLYDMLGNVDQWTLNLYNFTRLGRLSGLTGGFVIRGGNYATPLADLSTAARWEVLPFDPATGEATKLSELGFRVMIGVAIGDTPARAASMRQALNAAAAARVDPTQQPLQALPELEDDSADPEIRIGLQAVGAALAKARADTLHQQIDSVISLTYAIYKIQMDTHTLLEIYQSALFADMNRTPALQALAVDNDNLKRMVDAYSATLQSIIAYAPRPDIDQAVAIERGQMQADADPRLAFVNLTQGFLDQMSGGAFLTSEDLLATIKSVPTAQPAH